MKTLLITLMCLFTLTLSAKESKMQLLGGEEVHLTISSINQYKDQLTFGNKITVELKDKSERVIHGQHFTQYRVKSITTVKRLKCVKYILVSPSSSTKPSSYYFLRSNKLLVAVIKK